MKVLSIHIKGLGKQENQDSFYIKKMEQGGKKLVLFAISDGAGSAKHAKTGSRFATLVSIRKLSQEIRKKEYNLSNENIKEILEKTYLNMKKAFRRKYFPNFEDYYATLILGLYVETEKNKKAGFLSIGDSLIMGIKKNQEDYQLAGRNFIHKGEFSNSTLFFSHVLGDYIYDIKVLEKFDFLLITTDGFSHLLYREQLTNIDVSKRFHEIYEWSVDLEQKPVATLLNSFNSCGSKQDVVNLKIELEKVYSSREFMQINSDDKTLILIGDS